MPTAYNSRPLATASTPSTLNLSARIPELDGLRGVAIGLVLIWHFYIALIHAAPRSTLAYLQAAGRLTWSGVDLFFVLSGFLIGGILLDNRKSTNYFKVFYTRRFFRILPAYFLCIGAAYLLMRPVEAGIAAKFSFLTSLKLLPWAPHFFFLQNFWMATRNHIGLLGFTWSLAIEEQFYLTLPFLVRFLNPRRLNIAILVVILAAPILRTALLLIWPGHPLAGFALLPCRADSLMLGLLGAIAMRSEKWRERFAINRTAMRLILLLLGIGLFFLTKFSFDPFGFGVQTVGFTWLALFYLCLLLYVLTAPQSWLSGLLRSWPLRKLGTVAYGAYLYHLLVLWAVFGAIYSFWPVIVNLQNLGVSILALLIALILCQVSWVYFEKPLLQLGHRTNYQFGEIKVDVAIPPPVEGIRKPA